MVVANAVAALADIRDTSGSAAAGAVFTLSNQSLFKLLRALNECTEWGQVRARPPCPFSYASSNEQDTGRALHVSGRRTSLNTPAAGAALISCLHSCRFVCPCAVSLLSKAAHQMRISIDLYKLRPWRAQVYILDAIAKIPVSEAKDAESIVERVVPRLQHANSAVVLSAVKAHPAPGNFCALNVTAARASVDC